MMNDDDASTSMMCVPSRVESRCSFPICLVPSTVACHISGWLCWFVYAPAVAATVATNDSTLLQNESGAAVSLGVAIGNKLCSKRYTTVKVPVGGGGKRVHGARGHTVEHTLGCSASSRCFMWCLYYVYAVWTATECKGVESRRKYR